MAAVANHDISDIADSLAIDEDSTDSDGRNLVRALSSQFQYITVLQNKAVCLRYAYVLCQPPMLYQMAVFTVNRNEVAWPSQLQHRFQLFLAGMPRHVNFGNLLVVNLRPAPVKMIDEVRN